MQQIAVVGNKFFLRLRITRDILDKADMRFFGSVE
jgi:hypothetical protein